MQNEPVILGIDIGGTKVAVSLSDGKDSYGTQQKDGNYSITINGTGTDGSSTTVDAAVIGTVTPVTKLGAWAPQAQWLAVLVWLALLGWAAWRSGKAWRTLRQRPQPFLANAP